LPARIPEYNQLALMVGSAVSSTGYLAQAEELFSQVIENTQYEAEKALAYFNLFQIQLRHLAYDNALGHLQTAIDIEPQRYFLSSRHNIC
jgi:predicted negative regulator of RcsB-dependent stress response